MRFSCCSTTSAVVENTLTPVVATAAEIVKAEKYALEQMPEVVVENDISGVVHEIVTKSDVVVQDLVEPVVHSFVEKVL